jgi:trk system potassium uptake protein TrkA
MKIVIAGAGDVGFHLAELLAFENQDIVLIDTNQDVLDYAATHLDVLTLRGDASSIDVLEQASIGRVDLFLAVTTSEKTNLIASILAKKMGARQTVSRVSNQEYLVGEQRQLFKELGIDSLISPRQLAAREIQRLINQCSYTDIFEFEEGKITLVGLTLDDYSPLLDKRLSEFSLDGQNLLARPMAVLRGNKTIIPRGDTILRRNDHVYFITKKGENSSLQKLLGMKSKKVKNIMIIGGTGLAYETAQMLENNFNVTLVEREKDRCKLLAESLTNTLIINAEPSDIDLLVEEGLDRMDAFVALTPNSETNIIASLMAKNHGVYKTIAQVENKEYVHISQNIGVDTLINKKLIAANFIFRFVRKGQIEAITSLNGVDAEVIEFVVTKGNRLTRKPLKDLHFPDKALVGGVIRGNESLIPDGSFKLQLDDRVIVFAMPEAISRVEQLFR